MTAQQLDNAFGIAGRIALVSGGNRNIGRSIVLTLARAGVTPLILYRDDQKAAQNVCAEVVAIGARSGIYQADLADAASLKTLVRTFEKDFGSIDILVNYASIRSDT